MTDEHALYRAIIAQPEEDTPRLVYADWLQENDRSEEAEFIRIGCWLESSSPDHPEFVAWQTRQEELAIWLGTHAPGPKLKFHAGLSLSGESGWWQNSFRGFPRFLEFDGNHHVGLKPMRALATSLQTAFDTLPTRWLVVRFVTNDQLAELLRQPVIGQIELLTVQLYSTGEPNDEAARLIAECPQLKNLRGLCVAFPLSDIGAESLGRSENLRQLEWLSISGEEFRVTSLRSFAQSVWFNNLCELKIGGEAPGIGELCGMGRFPRLHSLELPHEQLSEAARKLITETGSFPVLSRLDLHYSYLHDGLMETLSGAKWLHPSHLDFSNCSMTYQSARALARAPWLGSVRWLGLRGNMLGSGGVAAIAGSRKLATVQYLDLAYNTIGAGGLRAIAGNAALRGLLSLNLSGHDAHVGQLTTAHFHEFLSRLDMPQLRHLSLRGRPVGAKAAKLLASARFASLKRLDLGLCGLTDVAVKTLLEAPSLQNLVELRLEGNGLNQGLEPLADPSIMPQLGSCSISGNNVGKALERKLRKRPGMMM